MLATDVVSDANVALKWFRHEGEEDVESARALLDRHRERQVVLHVLDLTFYELGNALLRGRARATAEQTATVLGALREICPTIIPENDDLALASELAAEHELTLYDAAYAAVAQRRDAPFVTFDRQLLAAGLGIRPPELLARIRV
jgi:predicted nucleic acid-binding protein